MHWIIPFAAPLAEAGRAALRSLALPNLAQLMARSGEPERDDGDEWSFTAPHERALARALGWRGGDGHLPWAAWQAGHDDIDPGELAWGLLTPAHWLLGTDQVSLVDPETLQLDAAASRTLFEAVQPLFTSEGFVMRWGAPLRWYAAHESLRGLRTASLDRVIGRNVDRWLVGDAADTADAAPRRLLRRLQNEVQMLLYTHPMNDAREAAGRLTVNSFWLSGCGAAQAARTPAPRIDARLRAPGLNEDWPTWCRAWETLDEGPLAEALQAGARGQRVTLTLAGERSAATLTAGQRGWWQNLRGRLARPVPAALLETL